jgi:1-acyl-sn-glycerol-3-phosphate acyltransferase
MNGMAVTARLARGDLAGWWRDCPCSGRRCYGPAPMLRGTLTSLLLFANLVLWGLPVLAGGALKLFLPRRARLAVTKGIAHLGECWVAGNGRIFDLMVDTRWEITGLEGVTYDGRYLILSNHLSWLDIFVAQRAFHGHAAFIRFFLKRELAWFPIVGQCAWALDFPFMKRHSPEVLGRHPEKRHEDLETTREACRRYRNLPVAILNYLEGTRLTPAKHLSQASPYRHLLRPRLGGIAFVLASLGDQLDATFDLTIAYPGGQFTIWDFVTNRVPRIVARIQRMDVPAEFCGEAVTRPGEVRDRFRLWIEQLWTRKDALLDELT